MKCPTCGSATKVDRVWGAENGRAKRRARKCSGTEEHHFQTSETQSVSVNLADVLVRRSGDGQLTERGFNRDRLLRDVQLGVLKRMKDHEVNSIVEETIRDLEFSLEELSQTLTISERKQRPGFTIAISDTSIREAVEQRLRKHEQRMPHVLYALSTLGRSDRKGRSGFADADDVLTWMSRPENYPDLRFRPFGPRGGVTEQNWFPPPGPAPLPLQVIKRDLETRRGFGLERFEASIRAAMVGRPGADDRSVLTAKMVLWELAGQQQVLTSQLAGGVTSCLRKLDDIAYLRWVAIGKNMASVREFANEASGLITHPSPRLRFLAV